MQTLAAALAATPRRWPMPPLPADVESARAAGTDIALAFAIDSARTGAVPGARELFIQSLAELIEKSVDAVTGDAAFQALLLRSREPSVREYVRLQSHAAQDARTIRRLVDAIAHPAKHGGLPDEERARLAHIHELATRGHWRTLRDRAIHRISEHPSLQRLADYEALRGTDAVAQYAALIGAQGPLAGTDAASEQGRNSARAGDAAEAETVLVLKEIARMLQVGSRAPLRVAQGLKTPRAFPGENGKAKDEWDVALLAEHDDGARVQLLGEVKASPAAGPPDFSRLVRGLQRLALADGGTSYTFDSGSGPIELSGASLRALEPVDRELPWKVVYFSTAPAGQLPPTLSAASKAVLLAEEGSIAYARDHEPRALAPIWDALPVEPRLRAALHQYDTARRVCDAMLHPQDLLDTLRVISSRAASR
jgi:hypothetical protein